MPETPSAAVLYCLGRAGVPLCARLPSRRAWSRPGFRYVYAVDIVGPEHLSSEHLNIVDLRPIGGLRADQVTAILHDSAG